MLIEWVEEIQNYDPLWYVSGCQDHPSFGDSRTLHLIPTCVLRRTPVYFYTAYITYITNRNFETWTTSLCICNPYIYIHLLVCSTSWRDAQIQFQFFKQPNVSEIGIYWIRLANKFTATKFIDTAIHAILCEMWD